MTKKAKRVPKVRLMGISELDAQLQEKVKEWQEMGADPNLFLIWGHMPAHILTTFLEFYNKLRYMGRIDVGLKEMVRLRIAHLNGCHY